MTGPSVTTRRAPTPAPSSPTPRRGMTLVELLVAMAILGVLAAMIVGVAGSASRTAREARSKQLVARLHALVMDQMDSYRTRRVELNERNDINPAGNREDYLDHLESDLGANFATLTNGQRFAWGRLGATRELMKLEMPDRWSDILGAAVPTSAFSINFATLNNDSILRTRYVGQRSPLTLLYLRELNRIVSRPGYTREKLLENQSAECLYLMVMNATADGEARGLFNEGDTGDTDEDGALEFLDAWGKPIGFLRWAPGLRSDLQLSYVNLNRIYRRAENRTNDNLTGEEAVLQAVNEDRDPFDLFRVDGPEPVTINGSGSGVEVLTRGWRQVPLIYSGGSDEEPGLRDNQEDGGLEYVSGVDPYNRDINSAEPGDQRLGETVDAETAADDITNHRAGTLSRAG